MDFYTDALQAADSAAKVKRWAQPVKIFGYIVIAIAAITALVGVIGALASAGRSGSAGLVTGVAALAASALVFLQGSVVLMLANYMQMRADETSMRVSQIFTEDEPSNEE